MDEFIAWWGTAVTAVLNFLGTAWGRLYRGIMYNWDTRFFVLAMGAVIIVAAAMVWRRRA